MNRKVQPYFSDRGKMIRLVDLPVEQASLFSGWVSQENITPLEEGFSGVDYDEYEYWFDFHFTINQDFNYLL